MTLRMRVEAETSLR